jgi:hypothetical protein
MKNVFSITFFLTVLTLIFFSCTKHKDDTEEHIPAYTINFSSPVSSTPYQFGDSVAIQGTVISTETIHGYDLIIKKANDTSKVFFLHVHDHNDTILLNKKWKNIITGPANMEAQIILYLDHDGHTGTKKATFKVQ